MTLVTNREAPIFGAVRLPTTHTLGELHRAELHTVENGTPSPTVTQTIETIGLLLRDGGIITRRGDVAIPYRPEITDSIRDLLDPNEVIHAVPQDVVVVDPGAGRFLRFTQHRSGVLTFEFANNQSRRPAPYSNYWEAFRYLMDGLSNMVDHSHPQVTPSTIVRQALCDIASNQR